MPDVVVVGAGIAGLVAARDLAAGGLSVTLLEATDRLGGKVARHTVGGLELDAGAESFATRRGTVTALAAELGLEPAIVQPNPAGAWLQPLAGPALPLPKTALLGIPGTPLAADVIAVVGMRAALRAQLDELMPSAVGAKERTLGGLVRRRMGDGVVDRLVAPVVIGIHSRHPDELDVDVVAPGLRGALRGAGSLAHAVLRLRDAAPAGTAVSGFEGGIAELVEALAADLRRLGVVIRTGAVVSSVDARGVTLAARADAADADDGERIDARRVVLAAPLGAATAPSILLTTLVLESAALDAAPRGTGVLVAPGAPGIRAKALTHGTAKWSWLAALAGEHRHVVRLSYDARLVDGLAADALERQAVADASALLDVRIPAGSVVGFSAVGWPAVPPAPRPIEGVTVVGEGVAGTGLAAVIAHARAQAEHLLQGMEP
ncbi:protoporphyrinogen/coproporphyrinogen oxidase [Lacisediminihabitans profunda]|uniref:FAD-dependent oxidoreductase n=1 Tax=Lacisediminihabitans profunda TaxID=2594790 RepID=A0A5C8UNA4_9MICO|nr:FAD-dependent oxidoreductase [Lacisediminihabitans profunda]TXN29391.1 FAD-dependent oxidoreductase [Lacisediminihabitans profunda]